MDLRAECHPPAHHSGPSFPNRQPSSPLVGANELPTAAPRRCNTQHMAAELFRSHYRIYTQAHVKPFGNLGSVQRLKRASTGASISRTYVVPSTYSIHAAVDLAVILTNQGPHPLSPSHPRFRRSAESGDLSPFNSPFNSPFHSPSDLHHPASSDANGLSLHVFQFLKEIESDLRVHRPCSCNQPCVSLRLSHPYFKVSSSLRHVRPLMSHS